MKNDFGKVMFEHLLSYIDYTSKPSGFDGIRNIRQGLELFFFHVVEGAEECLPVYTCEQLGISSPGDFFKLPDPFEQVPQYFILDAEGERFLVNTNGLNYCREMVRL
jgi:hypothetical protein